ncbi:MAG: hypothetical protein [Bacteriophage sp.]|nr:MAG: hypothetical protein [Bacteriophage sp.]
MKRPQVQQTDGYTPEDTVTVNLRTGETTFGGNFVQKAREGHLSFWEVVSEIKTIPSFYMLDDDLFEHWLANKDTMYDETEITYSHPASARFEEVRKLLQSVVCSYIDAETHLIDGYFTIRPLDFLEAVRRNKGRRPYHPNEITDIQYFCNTKDPKNWSFLERPFTNSI